MQSLHLPSFGSREGSAEDHHDASWSALGRAVRRLAGSFKGRPDLSLVNAKFTDALERELAGRGYRF